MPAALHANGITMRFAGLVALREVGLSLRRGEVLGLIGPNGSGKSTLVNVVSGVLRPNAGQVVVDGTDVTGGPPARVARHGVSRSFQTVRLFTGLSVRDNVAAVVRRSPRPVDDFVDGWLERLGIAHLADRRAGDLAYGLQRRLEIARALATEPRYLLLDEPAAGLNDDESGDLERIIRGIADDEHIGCGVLVIDHDMRLITALCDRVQVLFNGATIAEGDPADVRRDARVIEAYLGAKHQTPSGGTADVDA